MASACPGINRSWVNKGAACQGHRDGMGDHVKITSDPCMTAVKRSVVGSGPMRCPMKSFCRAKKEHADMAVITRPRHPWKITFVPGLKIG